MTLLLKALMISYKQCFNYQVRYIIFYYVHKRPRSHFHILDVCRDEELNSTLINKLPDVLLITDKLDFHVESTSSLFKFLLDLLTKEKFKEIVLNSIHQTFFHQFLDKLSNYSVVNTTKVFIKIRKISLISSTYILEPNTFHVWNRTFHEHLRPKTFTNPC